MADDEGRTEIIRAELEGGISISIQATPLGGEELAGTPPGPHAFKEVTDTVEGLAKAMIGTLKKVRPRTATVEFGLQIGIESGKLTALLVKGTGSANLKITLEWGEIGDSDTALETDEAE
jgi:hypothetical protein